ncbi:zinc-binding dehydrogenase [Streptosporangium sp. NPDC049376]|uniref:zinc-binding dehydrogenase n=1 Tax=Streptosporangium sp. NPDC049376 TaxID=3366192 RepID=UPI00379B6884
MKALVPTGDLDSLVRYDDVAAPCPKPDEALVAVEAFSVNRGEFFLLARPREGWRPGKDIAGTVVRAADNGTGPGVGERVVAHPASAGWAEKAAVPISSLAVLPGSMTAVTAAALPLAGLTALRLMRRIGGVLGKRILITGASGGVGHYFVELAAASGAEVTAVSASPERGLRLAELGAADVVHDVAEATGPFDVVLESVGGDSAPKALLKTAKRGTFIWFGQASRQPATFSFFDFFAGPESARLHHFHYADSDVADGTDLATLVRLTATGRLHPEIGRETDWADTATVLADLRDRRIRGKAVLHVEPAPASGADRTATHAA